MAGKSVGRFFLWLSAIADRLYPLGKCRACDADQPGRRGLCVDCLADDD